MKILDTIIPEALQQAGDTSTLRSREAVGGGMISQAFKVRTERGEYLLKLSADALPGFFAAEAHGLVQLAGARAVRVPTPLAHRDYDNGRVGFILMEWLETAPAPDRDQAGAALGQALAELHRATAPAYGFERDNYLGINPQPNQWADRWIDFFRERRLRVQVELARRNGYLSSERERRIDRLLTRLDSWIDEAEIQPSLIHGDLWSGNFLIAPTGQPMLVDPAAYYGDREAELAYMALFGGFPSSCGRAYDNAWPLRPGWRERRDIYNLYHLINHLNHFGESYGPSVDQLLQRYGGGE